ncbi:MAG: cysteine--tRNA ligase, partial [Deltaproteobacteria bacterium]|nr:cysteine--tRNA ligase [Deltaproteobacteria bacterium]
QPVKKLDGFIQRLLHIAPGGGGHAETDQLIYDVKQGFTDALDDDMNISGALASLFAFVAKVGIPLKSGLLTPQEGQRILDTVSTLDRVLGILSFEEEKIGEEARCLLKEREALRKQGRWEEADAIRERVAGMGIDLSDTAQGVTWRLR